MPRLGKSLIAAACLRIVFVTSASAIVCGQESTRPLHQRLDALVEQAAVGPLSGLASDADFIRRVHLDFTGVIPSPEQVREFLSDISAGKRVRKIDQLLASPAFARYLAVQWSAMILERRTEKSIKHQEWERYLFESVFHDRPLDQLFRELVYIGDSAAEPHPATKFLLNRDVEPNAVTREFGRLAFGMDLQCAQCHNHPLVNDYLQADYYGLFAFVNRTASFTDPKTKQVRLSEKADGGAPFKSVFTGDSREDIFPRLPKGISVYSEPWHVPGQEYKVAPDKSTAGVPKFSRREMLASLLADNRQFQRNIANRLWLLMFGRGLVHPVDFHHAENPPQNPALLSLLASELRAAGFQMKPILREIALSRTYQRSCDEPDPQTINFGDIEAKKQQLQGFVSALNDEIKRLEEVQKKSDAEFKAAYDAQEKLALEKQKFEKIVLEHKKKLDEAASQRSAVETSHAKLERQHAAVNQATEKLNEAAKVLANDKVDDKVIAEAATKIGQRLAQLAQSLESAKKSLAEKDAQHKAALATFAKSESEMMNLLSKSQTPSELTNMEARSLRTLEELFERKYELKALGWRVSLCDSLLQFATYRETDVAKAEAAWQTIIERWTIAGQIAPLKPLLPEQLAASTLHAAGMFARQIDSVSEKIDKQPPDRLKNADPSTRDQVRTEVIQLTLLDAMRDTFSQFVTHFGGQVGEEFQATVNQALFIGNGAVVDAWLKPDRDNLSDRLNKLESPAKLADELYIATLSRPATPSEIEDITQLIGEFPGKRTETISELIWAMISSNEFRFNH